MLIANIMIAVAIRQVYSLLRNECSHRPLVLDSFERTYPKIDKA